MSQYGNYKKALKPVIKNKPTLTEEKRKELRKKRKKKKK